MTMYPLVNTALSLVFVFGLSLLPKNGAATASFLSYEIEDPGFSSVEEVRRVRRDLFEDQEVPLYDPGQSASDLEEKENKQNEKEPLVFTEGTVGRLAHMFGKKHSGLERGKTTVVTALLASLALLVLHVVAQKTDGKPIGEDLTFRKGTGRLTFTGLGLVMAVTALAVGTAQVALKVAMQESTSSFHGPWHNGVLLDSGLDLMRNAGVAIVLGWLLSWRLVIMQLAGAVFAGGLAISLLSLLYMIRDGQRAYEIFKQVYKPGDKAVESSASNTSAQVFINKVVLEFMKGHIERQEAASGGSALANVLAEMDALNAAARAKENKPDGKGQNAKGEGASAEAGVFDEAKPATDKAQPAADVKPLADKAQPAADVKPLTDKKATADATAKQ